MNYRSLMPRKAGKKQRGAAAVEFALVSMLFFTILFGVMEFGRLLYVWNTVQEVSRNAARQAVITDFNNTAAINAIKQTAVFRTDAGSLPGAPEITSDMVKIRYLNIEGSTPTIMPTNPGDNVAACLDEARADQCIRFVEACVSISNACDDPVKYEPMIGLFSFLNIEIPMSTVRMPAESLGFSPEL